MIHPNGVAGNSSHKMNISSSLLHFPWLTSIYASVLLTYYHPSVFGMSQVLMLVIHGCFALFLILLPFIHFLILFSLSHTLFLLPHYYDQGIFPSKWQIVQNYFKFPLALMWGCLISYLFNWLKNILIIVIMFYYHLKIRFK